MDKVLVIKQQGGIRPQYPVGAGGPVLVLGGGGDQRGARGRTLRERLGGAAGKIFGALGSLTGKHRSLGGVVQSAISGAAQGGAIGGALGRAMVGRKGQAQADYDEATRQKYTEEDVRGNLGMFSGTKPKSPEEMRNQMKYLAQRRAEEQAEANARAREERQRSGAYARAMGTEVGAEDRNALEQMRREANRMGVPVDELMGNLGRFARSPYFQSYQIDRALEGLNLEPEPSQVKVVNAAGQDLGPVEQAPLIPSSTPNDQAGAETNKDETAAQNQQTGMGMDAAREQTVPPMPQLPSMNEEEKEEEEENNQGKVGVVQLGENTRLTKPNRNLVGVQGQ